MDSVTPNKTLGGARDSIAEAAAYADDLAAKKARSDGYWNRIGTRHDKRDRSEKLLKELSPSDNFCGDAGPGEVTTDQIWQDIIGREVDRSSWIDSQTRARELREQSEDIVERLERNGVVARNQSRGITLVGLCSGEVEQATDFRNCNMIPMMQSKNVHDMLKHVRYLLDTTRANQLRMLVVSGGWSAIDEYRDDHKAHCRRMSKFASDKLLKKFGISVEYYNVENTIHRVDGSAMLNLHSHAILRFSRRLGAKKWKQYLAFAKRHFPKGYVHDSAIAAPAEAVKYVFKPSEFELLTDAELVELFLQIVGGRPKFDPDTGEIFSRPGTDIAMLEGPLKFFHPLGDMRLMRRQLKAEGRKLVRVPTKNDQWVWRVTEKRKAKDQPELSDNPKTENVALAITVPMPKLTRHFEPYIVVQGYDGNFAALIEQNGLEESVAKAQAIWRATRAKQAREAERAGKAGPLLSMKHTTTTTVLTQDGCEDVNYPPPPDLKGQTRSKGMLQ